MEATEDLDSTLWQELPFELLANILTKLPVSTLMSLCLVCKQWKTLIQSSEFARRCDSIQPLAFFQYVPDILALYSFDLAIPNSKTNRWEKHKLNFSDRTGTGPVVAADQGLICFDALPSWSNTLFIYHPLTRQLKELTIPAENDVQFNTSGPSRRPGKLVGLIVDHETGNYKLIVGFVKKIGKYETRTRTQIYDSGSSTWTSTSGCPNLPFWDDGYRPGYWNLCKPGASVRCGEFLYWLVEEVAHEVDRLRGPTFRSIVRFDVKAGIWTVDEPDVPYERGVMYPELEDCPPNFPYTLPNPPRWNFHLATNDGTVYVILFDSLLKREAFSGQFSSLIPEVMIIDADFVCKVRELANPPEHYLPTKAVSQGEVWYVVFEYGGIRRSKGRLRKPLLVFAYNPRRNVWGWLPEFDSGSLYRNVITEGPVWRFSLPELLTCTLSLRAFV